VDRKQPSENAAAAKTHFNVQVHSFKPLFKTVQILYTSTASIFRWWVLQSGGETCYLGRLSQLQSRMFFRYIQQINIPAVAAIFAIICFSNAD
jgi:hypothetical protein